MIQKYRSILEQFFKEGHQRTVAIRKNIAVSFLIKGSSILIQLALVSVTIKYIDSAKYGVWLTLSSIIGWFSFFDVGFGHGLRNRFAEAKAIGETEKAQIYVSTTYTILTLVFTSVWLVFFIFNFFIDWNQILNIPSDETDNLQALALILFSSFCILMVLKTINMLLIADQRPAKAAYYDMMGQLISLIGIVILTNTTTGSLIYLGLILSVAPILVTAISSILLFSGPYKNYMPSVKSIDLSHMRDIMGIGLKFFMLQFSAIIIFQTNNIVITQMLGPESVTIYNIAYKYFFMLSMLFMIIVSPFWSAFTEAYAKQDFGWMQTSLKSLKKIWLLVVVASIGMILLSGIFYHIWIGDTVKIPFSVSLLMAIYAILFTRFNLFVFLINGVGKLRLQILINIIACILYIPAAIYTCKIFGLLGIIVSNIAISLTHAILSQIQLEKIVKNRAYGIWGS